MNEWTTKEAGERLGIDEATVRKWCASGKLPARRIGGHRGIWLIDADRIPADIQRSPAGRKPVRRPNF